MTEKYNVEPTDMTKTTTATYRVREMELAESIKVLTEHNDRVIIPAGTVFKFTELVSFETCDS